MADDARGNSSEIELEVKRRADCSWHPCHVSLRYGGGLSVKVEGQDSEDIILEVEDAFARLRVRSVPLQGDNCSYIEKGNHVLAVCEQNSQRFFCDAVVEKAIRVRHSKRASCRCTFMIKWLFRDVENEILTIPSGSIMKLAAESIISHPVVAAFLNSLKNSCLSTSSSSPTAFEETEGEIDLHGLLEKQIEEIGSLADLSKKELPKDTLFGFDSDPAAGEGWSTVVASEQVNQLRVELSCRRNHLRRSERKRSKMQSEMDDSVVSAPSSVEQYVENRSPLSPLAARAVLASLVSKVPQKPEFVHHEEGKCVSVMDYITQKHDKVIFDMVTSGGSEFSTIEDIEMGPAKLVDKVESVMTNKKAALGKKLHDQKSHGALFMDGCDKNEPFTGSGGSLSIRSNRSLTRKGSGSSNGDVASRMLAEEVKFGRVTRSACHKGKGNFDVEVIEALQDKPERVTRSNCTVIKRECGTSNGEDKSRNVDEKAKFSILTNTTRLTRSAAREGTRNSSDRVKEALLDKPENHAQRSNCVPDARVSTKKRTLPLVNDELKEAESDEKQKRFNALKMRRESPAEGSQTNVNIQSEKKPISSKNHPLRFSPRLRHSDIKS